MIKYENYIPSAILGKFEFHNYGHAIEIISQAFPVEWKDIKSRMLLNNGGN